MNEIFSFFPTSSRLKRDFLWKKSYLIIMIFFLLFFTGINGFTARQSETVEKL